MIDDLAAFFRGERREFEIFRKGVVGAINQNVVPWLATINGRPMPYIQPHLEVGDVVIYVDQPDPFAWAKFDSLGEIKGTFTGGIVTGYGVDVSGGWFPEYTDLVPISGQDLRAQPFQRIDPTFGTDRWPGGILLGTANFMASEIGEVIEMRTGIYDVPWNVGGATTFPPGPIADPAGKVIDLFNFGGAFSLVTFSTGIGENDMPGFWPRTSYEAYPEPFPSTDVDYSLTGFSQVWTVVFPATDGIPPPTSIRTKRIATAVSNLDDGVDVYLPTINAPGPDWLLLYLVQVEAIADSGASVGTISVDDDEGYGTNRRPNLLGGTSQSSSITGRGGNFLIWQRSTGAGPYRPRVRVDGASFRGALSSFVLR